jgi:CubicO group peptidase (beta-lactamase class C family)
MDARNTRREFDTRAALDSGVGAVAPFAFVRRAAATTDLHRFVRQQMHKAVTPGVAVAVVRGEEIVFATGAGWADREQGIRVTPDTAFMLASVSKTVTCAGIMTLVEDGLLDLDADINGYLPFEVHVPAAPHVPITMRMLLTHTSAIRDRWRVWGRPYSDPTLYFHGDSPIALGDFMQSYFAVGGDEYRPNANFYDRRPGTAYAYSNFAVALAGYVAEFVSGTDFDELCTARIIDPLGMTDSGFRLADIGTPNLAMPYKVDRESGAFTPYFQYGYPDYPDGELRTSARHLAAWLGAFMNFGKLGDVRVLDRDTVIEIRRHQLGRMVSWHQGLIWYGSSAPGFFRLGHTGGDYGVSTQMFFRPDTRVGVITLTNSSMGVPRWRHFRDIQLRMFEEFS